MHYDVFNGDADGIIALLQLRLAEPKESTLVTGIKRDIELLKQVDPSLARSVTVLDISMEKNAKPLNELLGQGIDVFYVDHHRAGDIPKSDKLTALINTDANICTSLLVDEYLAGKYRHWAIAAAFGDNMVEKAKSLSLESGLTEQQQQALQQLGIYINYNGYGRSVEDLHYHPAQLFQLLLSYPEPLELIAEEGSVFSLLRSAYRQDMDRALSANVLFESASCKIIQLDDAPWARRISGVLGNELANQSPDKAHAVLTCNADNSFTVSVRAPLNNKQGADEVCIQFPTGGGRAGAAGINQLPQEMLDDFIQVLSQYYL